MKTKLTPAQKKWLISLESGKYKQTKGRLRRDDGYCCLGVACQISGLCEWNEWNVYMNRSATLPKRVMNQLGMFDPSGDILPHFKAEFFQIIKSAGYRGEIKPSLSSYNDFGATFKQIATAIRQLPEAVFMTKP